MCTGALPTPHQGSPHSETATNDHIRKRGAEAKALATHGVLRGGSEAGRTLHGLGLGRGGRVCGSEVCDDTFQLSKLLS